MSLDVRGTTGRILIWLSVVVLGVTLAAQVVAWRAGWAKLRPDPGWTKLGMVLAVLTICAVIVARSLADDGQAKPALNPETLDEPR